jgi:hypothetical protein
MRTIYFGSLTFGEPQPKNHFSKDYHIVVCTRCKGFNKCFHRLLPHQESIGFPICQNNFFNKKNNNNKIECNNIDHQELEINME